MIIKKQCSGLAILALAVILVVIGCLSLTFGQIDIPLSNAVAVIGYQLGLPGFTESGFSKEYFVDRFIIKGTMFCFQIIRN